MSSTRSLRRILGRIRSPDSRSARSAAKMLSLLYHLTGSTPSTRSCELIRLMFWICCSRLAMPSRANASSFTGIRTSSAAIRAAELAALNAGGQSIRQ